jgi:protoporphyrinogen/coproporphyrinogen III oxidase
VSQSDYTTPRIAVIGGGISGLAAAHRLNRLLPRVDIHVYEASDRLGGALHTLRTADATLEQGADSFLIKTPYALELCRELGLADRLVPTNEQHRRALVVRDGKLFPVPDGFVLMQPQNLAAMLRSPVLSIAGKLRLLVEPRIPVPEAARQAGYDESVASFATRRLGREVYERLAQPLVAGVFVADAHKLSLAATFPEFLEAEREHGSLWASVKAKQKEAAVDGAAKPLATADLRHAAARYGQFVTLQGGLRTLVDALATSLPEGSIELSVRVREISRVGPTRWVIATDRREAPDLADGVIVATPAPRATELMKACDAALSEQLGRIEYASSAVVTLVYPRAHIAHPLDGFGAVVPAVENRPIVAASFLNVKFPAWAPADRAVIRVFMGGVLRPEMVDRSDGELIAIAKAELGDLIEARGEPVEPPRVARWRQSMPQYHVGHLHLVDEIERRVATHHGLQLAGNAYRGVGIPQCIRSGRTAAERLIAQLQPAAV